MVGGKIFLEAGELVLLVVSAREDGAEMVMEDTLGAMLPVLVDHLQHLLLHVLEGLVQ